MRPQKRRTLLALVVALTVSVAVPLWAAAASPDDTPDRPHTQNMHLLGSSLRPGAVTGPPPVGPGTVPWDTRNTDLAFWDKLAIQGRYDGFRVLDIRAPGNPEELAFFPCVSPQGDVGIWGDLVFRSVDSPQRTDQCTDVSQTGNPIGAECAPAPSPCTGFEGIQIFDIGDLSDIQHVASVPLDCGAHTHTVVPDPEQERVLIYNSVSGNTLQMNPGKCGNRCPGPPFNREDIVEVPLDDPASAQVLGSFDLGDHDGEPVQICHDFGVILGDVNLGACAGHGISVFDLSDLANPVHLYTTGAPLAGGLVQTEEMKTAWFHDAETGEIIGKYVLPRPQSQYENCTIHNYNLVPHPTRNLLVHGSYQSGTALVDFTDPENAYEVAWMDPDPLDPPSATSPGGRTNFRGGDWSSYWYNGYIYESDARRGLYVWNVSARELAGPIAQLDYVNPQTNHLSLDAG